MHDAFDFDTYWWIVNRIASNNRCTQFRNPAPEPFFILRHDVDYSPAAALRLAQMEAQRSMHATYFLLTGSRYYNLCAPEHAHFARRLTELGHEVGLHYDINTFRAFPENEWPALLRAQANLLSELAGQRVVSIAMHQPALSGGDPFRSDSLGFINAYGVDAVYISDSCRAWRDSAWSMLTTGDIPKRLQLNLHPINWSDRDRDRDEIFRGVHQQLMDEIRSARDQLLSQIAVHDGVVEHERRVEAVCR
ncbi:MAG: hypothetical protein M3041_19720 [Acidobacteriota bacterium]|nr:hypothetical protein [Acidobacteriota bacterium]